MSFAKEDKTNPYIDYKSLSPSQSTSPIRNSTVKDILTHKVEKERSNRFQRPERATIAHIKDENLKLSEDLLNKSA